MAISENIHNAGQARLVAAELKKAAGEIALGIVMSQGMLDPMSIVYTLDTVATDFETWAEGLEDDEEVFVPTARLAEIDQATAEFNEFVQKFN